MTAVYRSLYQEHERILYWLYTSLENGIHSCYPGHGGYPAEYDHRKRDWYKRAMSGEGISWTPPYVNVSSRQPVLTAAMPVRRPDGSYAGVTAIDVAVADIVKRGWLPKFRSAVAKLVVLAPRAAFDPNEPQEYDIRSIQPDQLGLFVLAEPTAGQTDTRWQAPYKTTWLESDDRDQFLAMIRDMLQGRSRVRELTYLQRPSLWSYGQVWKDRSHLVVIVSQDEVIADAVRAEQTVLSLTHSRLKMTAAVVGLICLLIFGIVLFGSRAVTRPVRQLAKAARQIAQGDLGTRVAIRTRDELGELGRTFNEMVPQLQDRMRMRQSLALAMEVQQHLLPAGPPDMEGIDVAGRSVYCDETGGDYYDFLDLAELGPGQLGIAVGDVTGHGIAAALLMTTARALLRSRADQPGTLAELMSSMNRHLTADTSGGRFMTLFYSVIDARRKTLRWASAGHDPALVYHLATETFDELESADIPLGVAAHWSYKEFGLGQLAAGDIIVIGTDGIWETRNPQAEQFGKDALRQIIRRCADLPAQQISSQVISALTDFRQSRPQEDDITLVVVKVLP